MKQIDLRQLLSDLTPDMRAYLFPGVPLPEFAPAEPEVSFGGAPDDWDFCPAAAEYFDFDGGSAEPAARSISLEERAPVYADPESLDPRTERILSEIRRLQEKYDVSIEELEVILGYTVRLSTLRITRSGRMFLPEYDNVEVKMPNISKALYFLYLRHPEGLRFKDIPDHKPELLQLYQGITGRDDPDEIGRSIDLLADPFGNALNVNASRIKTAFRNVVSDRIARFYYLSGSAGEEKKVPLDRDLVIWEY